MSSEQDIIGKDDTMAYSTIMGDMRISHEIAVTTCLGGTGRICRAMNGNAFPQDIIITDNGPCFNILKGKILRCIANDSMGMNLIPEPYVYKWVDNCMRSDNSSFTNTNGGMDNCVRPYNDIFA
jgi:hypothetical protein